MKELIEKSLFHILAHRSIGIAVVSYLWMFLPTYKAARLSASKSPRPRRKYAMVVLVHEGDARHLLSLDTLSFI